VSLLNGERTGLTRTVNPPKNPSLNAIAWRSSSLFSDTVEKILQPITPSFIVIFMHISIVCMEYILSDQNYFQKNFLLKIYNLNINLENIS